MSLRPAPSRAAFVSSLAALSAAGLAPAVAGRALAQTPDAPGVWNPGGCASATRSATIVPPDARLRVLDGDALRLRDLRGYAVWVNFFTTWCAGCASETPAIVAAAARDYARGLRVVGISVDERDDVVRAFRDRFGIGYPLALDGRGRLFTAAGLTYLPFSLFIDRTGAVRCLRRGELSPDAIAQEVEAIV